MSKKLYSYCGTSHTHMLDEFANNVPYWCTYAYGAQEWGTEQKKEHVQFICQSSLSVKKIGKVYGYHVEVMRGTFEQAKAYCMKDSGRKFEFGKWTATSQGKRTDLVEISQAIKDGKSLAEIEEMFPAHYLRMAKHIEDAYWRINRRKAASIARAAPRKVILYHGPSGSGKTSKVVKECKVPLYRVANQDNTMWWKGYEGQDAILLDDFKGGMKLNTLLGILDPWYDTDISLSPAVLARLTASQVYITSVMLPEEWYPAQDISELKRRISSVIECVM